MKQTFVVEIDCVGESFESIYNDGILKWAKMQNCQLKQINDCTLTNFRVLSPVEQSVEPLKDQEKALDLLKRASRSLDEYKAKLDGNYNDPLATEIEDYIGRNTKG